MKLFEMKHIKKSFDGLEVLKDISLDVEEGEVLSIIGPSGSGKSTILRCATGLETPDSGEIIKTGDVGLVFQQFNLFPHFSVMKNIVDAPLKVQKRKKDEVYVQARSLLKKMGLADKENAYPFQLSGGQQQRTSIGRALITRPSIVLADEPTGNLDSKSGDVVIHTLSHINRELGKTIVMVTHDPKMASYCSRLILLKDGMILEDMRNGGDQEAFYQEILGKMKEL